MITKHAPSFPVSVFIAGDHDEALTACRDYCDRVGLCVTVTPTNYVYTGGEEAGVIVGLINYPRFPSEPRDIAQTATLLALELMHKLEQQSVSVQTPDETTWFSIRPVDLAQGMSAFGQDREAGLEARPASPVGDSRCAPKQSS
jgi:hypothetical protein